jgi:hypothetical protein
MSPLIQLPYKHLCRVHLQITTTTRCCTRRDLRVSITFIDLSFMLAWCTLENRCTHTHLTCLHWFDCIHVMRAIRTSLQLVPRLISWRCRLAGSPAERGPKILNGGVTSVQQRNQRNSLLSNNASPPSRRVGVTPGSAQKAPQGTVENNSPPRIRDNVWLFYHTHLHK